jgi:hypothetical protein
MIHKKLSTPNAWLLAGAVLGIVSLLAASTASAATYRSRNFVVTADSASLARRIAELAEEYRRGLADAWIGKDLPDWPNPCRITYHRHELGGSGWTSYRLNTSGCRDFQVTLRGELDRILEYVLPHEVAHTVLVSAVGCAIPRWAEEGVAMMSESESQRERQRQRTSQLLRTDAGYRLKDLFAATQYPSDHQRLIAFYAVSFSVTEFLVTLGGKSQLLRFLEDQQQHGWERSLATHYSYEGVDDLEADWRAWATGTGQLVLNELSDAALPE